MGAWPCGLSRHSAQTGSHGPSKCRSSPTRLLHPLHHMRPNRRSPPRRDIAQSLSKLTHCLCGSRYVLCAGEVRRVVKHHDGPSFAPFIRPVVNHRRLDFDTLHQIKQPRHAAHESVFALALLAGRVHRAAFSTAQMATITTANASAPNTTTCMT